MTSESMTPAVPAVPDSVQASTTVTGGLPMNELTERLTVEQPIVMGGADPTMEELRDRTGEMGYVLVKFTQTRGGTELGFPLDRAATDLSKADFDGGTGTVHVEGHLILNDDPVRCIATIDLATLKGTGRLALEEKAVVTTG
jgi:core binding factor beta subunit